MNNSNIVTQRFNQCVQRLRENKSVKSSRQLAIELDFLPQTLSEILNGRRDATIEVIRRAVERHHFNPIFLFTGEGDLFLTKKETPKTAESRAEITDSLLSTTFLDGDAIPERMLLEIVKVKNMIGSLQETVSQLVEKV